MARRASFGQTWLRLNLDLDELDLEAFNARLTHRQRILYTASAIAAALLVLAFLDPIGSLCTLAAGLWVIWNPGNRITRTERKIFLTTIASATYFGLLEKMSLLLNALLLWSLAYALFLVVLWRA